MREVRDGIYSFGAGDFLECEVRHIQRINDEGVIKKDFEILTVISHIPQGISSTYDYRPPSQDFQG